MLIKQCFFQKQTNCLIQNPAVLPSPMPAVLENLRLQKKIDAYYSFGSDSRELFAPYKIAKEKDFETHLNKYNVIHVDVASASILMNKKLWKPAEVCPLFFDCKNAFCRQYYLLV